MPTLCRIRIALHCFHCLNCSPQAWQLFSILCAVSCVCVFGRTSRIIAIGEELTKNEINNNQADPFADYNNNNNNINHYLSGLCLYCPWWWLSPLIAFTKHNKAFIVNLSYCHYSTNTPNGNYATYSSSGQ